jgi:protein-tyrosine phosphatase
VSLSGLCDLHCHYLPAVDDGVRAIDEGVQLCRALGAIGYDTVIATPHIRAGMFDNRKPGLVAVYETFSQHTAALTDLPKTGLAAEHFCDDIFLDLFARGETLPYPGGHAALVEFPPERLPLAVEDCFFRMSVRGVRPVIAHPERYAPVWKGSAPIENLVDRGALAQLDVMSLVGKYGRKAQAAAERLLEDGLYYLACSDSHKPADVPSVQQGIARLIELVGADEAQLLLSVHPKSILAGTIRD